MAKSDDTPNAAQWTVLVIVVVMIVAACALAAFGSPHYANAALTVWAVPLVDARLPTRTAWPPGDRRGFAVRFRRLRDCPTSFVWRWGGGERATVEPSTADQRERCAEGLVVEAPTAHVFEHPRVPRRVLVDAMRDADLMERMCFNWPAKTPCEE